MHHSMGGNDCCDGVSTERKMSRFESLLEAGFSCTAAEVFSDSTTHPAAHSDCTILSIDQDVGASHIARRVRSQIQIRSLEFVSLTFPAHRNLASPDRLRLGWDEVRNLRCDVAR